MARDVADVSSDWERHVDVATLMPDGGVQRGGWDGGAAQAEIEQAARDQVGRLVGRPGHQLVSVRLIADSLEVCGIHDGQRLALGQLVGQIALYSPDSDARMDLRVWKRVGPGGGDDWFVGCGGLVPLRGRSRLSVLPFARGCAGLDLMPTDLVSPSSSQRMALLTKQARPGDHSG